MATVGTRIRLFECIFACGLRVGAVRNAIGASEDRWYHLRVGRATWTEQEVQALERVFRPFGLTRLDLFDKNTEILPLNRRRRAKGTVKRPPEGSAA